MQRRETTLLSDASRTSRDIALWLLDGSKAILNVESSSVLGRYCTGLLRDTIVREYVEADSVANPFRLVDGRCVASVCASLGMLWRDDRVAGQDVVRSGKPNGKPETLRCRADWNVSLQVRPAGGAEENPGSPRVPTWGARLERGCAG